MHFINTFIRVIFFLPVFSFLHSSTDEACFLKFCKTSTSIVMVSPSYCDDEWGEIKKQTPLTELQRESAVSKILNDLRQSSHLSILGAVMSYVPWWENLHAKKMGALAYDFIKRSPSA